ncbi:LTA synthase family protein [Enterobacillus tribolii]|uniref:Phosphoglycerol transferase MdoB-like AlkP superfamily enzyme n=1 Tax=Enterobacillus tribolii TaxID=1487935 RepID=A0A370QHW6_9GAMM|nr:alkaline phosphatase family protein [Enterobacillus tribolii]MBW7982663.1 alkaline phosphatase family protein [Enterobacillus tribolii]RDK87942.1 phosphoglycerol transferase MdoB-like AlkP superfamily enzyme [Enterobacillus tribolii]
MYQQRIRALLRTIWFQLILLTLTMTTARYCMFHTFVDSREIAGHEHALTSLWFTGLRFDLRVAACLLLPVFVAGLLLSVKAATWRWLKYLTCIYCALITFVIITADVSNYFYYQTYHNFIDIFAFGLMDDETRAVVGNIWQGYPVARLLALTLLTALLAAALCQWLLHRLPARRWPTARFALCLLLSLILLVIFARGSLSTFPLRRNDAQISTVMTFNKLAPNGAMALVWAYGDHQEDAHFTPVTARDGDALLRQSGLDSLDARTPPNPWLAAHKPNVVMALMESMGSNMMVFDHLPENDLLGALRPAFQQDFVFRRFVSEGNGTAPSFAAMFFHSPAQNISHSSAQHTVLSGTPYSVYKKAGYKVIFITSSSRMWRNLGNYLPLQGVDDVYDQSSLMALYPESAPQLTDWGVPDEFAFRLAEKLLAESKQPLFISILTITNHPPYIVPPHYHPQPVAAPDALMTHAEVDQDEQLNIMRTYQYATDALGRFIADVKRSARGNDTLIAASGDHQMRRLRAIYPREQFLDRAVPFYLYVPQKILQHSTWRFDPSRPGSHKDIFPTLYAYSLSDTPYQALGGRNMLAPQDDPGRAFGYNEELWIDAKGAYPLTGRPAFYAWDPDNAMSLLPAAAVPGDGQQQKMSSYPALLKWQLNARVKGITQ